MNLFNLLIHSFSIIAVFKRSVIFRSILFLVIYLFFIYNTLSIITLFPVFIILIFVFLILKISSRENIEELNKSLENIDSIEILSNLDSR
jgi:Ca2+/Na+ antiporter